MISILRDSSTGAIRRASTSPYQIRTLSEMKECTASGYTGYLNQYRLQVGFFDLPLLENIYYADRETWDHCWYGSYDPSNFLNVNINYAADGTLHSHGNATYKAESISQLTWIMRQYTLPSGLTNPPSKVMLWLQNCGLARYRVVPNVTSGTISMGSIGYNIESYDWSPYGGLELYFWAVGGSGTCVYFMSNSTIQQKNVDAGNSIGLQSGFWPIWSGGILTDNLPNVCTLFAETGVVGCRLRWDWYAESVAPLGCRYCEGIGTLAADCGQPVVKLKYLSNPTMFAWG
jgi:hypothetical protein